MDMQKEVTARREQVDTLQGYVLHLEEALDKMYQVKNTVAMFEQDFPRPLKCKHLTVTWFEP